MPKGHYPRKGKQTPLVTALRSSVISLHWRDGGFSTRRVWREDWSSDQFEIFDLAQFNHLRSICVRFSIPLIEHVDDD